MARARAPIACIADDKRLQNTLKRLGVNTIPGISKFLFPEGSGAGISTPSASADPLLAGAGTAASAVVGCSRERARAASSALADIAAADESLRHLTAAFELIATDLDPLSAELLAPWTYGLDSDQLWPVGHSANSGATDFLKIFLKDCKTFDSSNEHQLTKTKTITGAEAMSSEPTWLSAKSGVVSNLGVSPPWAWSEPPLCHVNE